MKKKSLPSPPRPKAKPKKPAKVRNRWQEKAKRLELEAARNRQVADNWEETAARFLGDVEFYRGIVREIGELFGDAAKTSDDGSLQENVLALKVPELVRAMHARISAPFDGLEEWLTPRLASFPSFDTAQIVFLLKQFLSR